MMQLPVLRIQRARDVFFKKLMRGRRRGKQDDNDLEKAFTAALEVIEDGAFRWGQACPICRKQVEWVDAPGISAWARPYFKCEEHGVITATVLLVGFPPVDTRTWT